MRLIPFIRELIKFDCIYGYVFIVHIAFIHSMDWHSCFYTSDGLQIMSTLNECKDKCQLTLSCTDISYCRGRSVCHIFTVSPDTTGGVNNECPGCVVVSRNEMSQDNQLDVDTTTQTSVVCDTNIPDFKGCQLKGNMHHEGHSIKVHCDLLQYLCRNSTFVCGANGELRFGRCWTPIVASNSTCVLGVVPAGLYINIALGKPVTMSSRRHRNYLGDRLVDGIPGTSCALTGTSRNPYMIIDLENNYKIYSLYILASGYVCCPNFDVSFGDSISTISQRLNHFGAFDQDCTFVLDPPVEARYVKVILNGYGALYICEFEIYTIL